MTLTTLQAAARPRSYVSVNGQDAASYLNRMVSNEVEELDVQEHTDLAAVRGALRRP